MAGNSLEQTPWSEEFAFRDKGVFVFPKRSRSHPDSTRLVPKLGDGERIDRSGSISDEVRGANGRPNSWMEPLLHWSQIARSGQGRAWAANDRR